MNDIAGMELIGISHGWLKLKFVEIEGVLREMVYLWIFKALIKFFLENYLKKRNFKAKHIRILIIFY